MSSLIHLFFVTHTLDVLCSFEKVYSENLLPKKLASFKNCNMVKPLLLTSWLHVIFVHFCSCIIALNLKKSKL